MNTETIIVTPDSVPIEKEISPIVARAQALTVTSEAEHGVAQEVLKSVAIAERRVKELFEEPKVAAHQAHKAITKAEGKLLEPLVLARGILSKKCTAYEIEEQRKADEERQRLEVIAKQQEEERQLLAAVDAEAAGDKAGAEQILQEETVTPSIYVAPKVADVQGISTRTTWGAEVVSLIELVKYVAGNPNEIALLEANMPALNGRARSMKQGFKLPGCRLVENRSHSVRTA